MWRDQRHQRLEPPRDVALCRLAMIDVELQPDRVRADGRDERGCLLLGSQDVAGDVALVDRLDHQPHAGRCASSAAQARRTA